MGTANKRMGIGVASVIAGTVALTAGSAQAEERGTLNLGAIYSFTGPHESHGFGAEVSYMHFPDTPIEQNFGFGGFAEIEAYGLNDDVHPRFAVGGQFGSWIGGEVGLAYRGASEGYSPTVGSQLGLYLSMGYLTWAARGVIPFSTDGDLPTHGWEIGTSLALKIPVYLYGDKSPLGSMSFGSGRPLHFDDGVLLPDVREYQHCKLASDDLPANLDDRTREALRDVWLEDARHELASVGTFLRLAYELANLGAPHSLIRRSLAAVADERRHARACFAQASRFAGHLITPQALPNECLTPRTLSLRELALESYVDGALGEGFAARCAWQGAGTAEDPAVRQILTQIAYEEARHARLSWDIAKWCMHRGGPGVRAAVRECARKPGPSEAPAGPRRNTRMWKAQGRVDAATESRLYRVAHRTAQASAAAA